MMKKFIIRILIFSSPVIALYAYPMLRYANGESYGALIQLGSYFFDKEYMPLMAHNPGFKRHVILSEDVTEDICDSDVLVIGDSFTQMGYNNFMEYLQNQYSDRTIYGIHTFRYGEEWRYVHKSLEGSGRLLMFPGKTDVVMYLLRYAKRLPSTIVIESSEMWLMESIVRTKFELSEDSLEDYDGAPLVSSEEKYERYSQLLVSPDPIKCIFDGRAFNFAQDWIKRKLRIVENDVRKSPLMKPLFTNKGGESTLYYIPYTFTWPDEDIDKMRSMMMQIIDKGAERGVNIIFMVVPQKEHLYGKYMEEERFPETYLSNRLMDKASDPHYLICMPILNGMVESGERDVFLANDTHWSYKGAKACAEALKYKIEIGKQ